MKKTALMLVVILVAGDTTMKTASAIELKWDTTLGMEAVGDGYKTVAENSQLISETLEISIGPKRCFLLLSISASRGEHMKAYWRKADEGFAPERSVHFHVPKSGQPVVIAVDLNGQGTFDSANAIRLDPLGGADLRFTIARAELLTFEEIPMDAWPSLLGFRCYMSKLHFLPGELLQYRATLRSRVHPDRASSKILYVNLYDEDGNLVASDVQQFTVKPMHHFKELYGFLQPPEPLKPGIFRLEAKAIDQRADLILTDSQTFGVQDSQDPFIAEIPFKSLNDFTFIRAKDGVWHVFGIIRDLEYGGGWREDGQERTFFHGTSKDLRHWRWHEPVITISEEKYPDGEGHYRNRNVWAPHVILHRDVYYMFYTSVNESISQSISLAVSNDLFEWTEYEGNPIFTMEGVDWALWERTIWSDCRDPALFEDDGRFYMYVTATLASRNEADRGLIVVTESSDLKEWTPPRIALRGPKDIESPQVWKCGGRYYMVTSARGAGTFSSDHPVEGWRPDRFPLPPLREREKYVKASDSRIEEVVQLGDGSHVMATASHGNSLYFFRIVADAEGRPTAYTSPFDFEP